MFSSSTKKQQDKTQDHDKSSPLLDQQELRSTGSGASAAVFRAAKSVSQQLYNEQQFEETQEFLKRNKEEEEARRKLGKKQALLAREETIELEESKSNKPTGSSEHCCCFRYCCCCCCRMLLPKCLLVSGLVLICLMAAIYCLPYVEVEPRVPAPLPHIPFNFRDGPLKASTASQFKVERLFAGQLYGPESLALDSMGNMYLAVEGGFILYAHLNKSSPVKKSYYESLKAFSQVDYQLGELPELVKIAELNGIKQIPYDQHQHQKRKVRENNGLWRRECQLDESVYGQQLASMLGQEEQNSNEIDTNPGDRYNTGIRQVGRKKFHSNVVVSRCSKPLGIRLSPDENYLYVIDTLSGLYRINLKIDKPGGSSASPQRQVSKLIDFKLNKSSRGRQLLPVLRSDKSPSSSDKQQNQQTTPSPPTASFLNVSLMALDDLVIDYGAGSKGADVIYLSDASQNWQAVSFMFDLLEGRPSGAILRFDTGSNQLSVLDPLQVAHVRTSSLDLTNTNSRLYSNTSSSPASGELFYGIGAPRLDENDVFDDRPLHFPNGLELTDDKQAILIADSSNKRIVKHYIRGPRRGTSDLWAWTPLFPDNIRRGADKSQETYWVAGCGGDTTGQFDLLTWLKPYPRLRKYILKNVYLVGWIIEQFGNYILNSSSARDFGYGIKTGHTLCQNACQGMMVLQYNKHGDIIRSIYSKEFPSDLAYYSQVNEIFDSNKQEHALYLGSPAYSYVTKLVLPTNSLEIPTNNNENSLR